MKKLAGSLAVLLAVAGPAMAMYGQCAMKTGGMGMSKVPLLLLALAVGYWVLTLSQSQGKPLDLIGRITGGIILLVALGGLLCAGLCGMKACWGQKAVGCGMMGAKACPMSAASSVDAPAK